MVKHILEIHPVERAKTGHIGELVITEETLDSNVVVSLGFRPHGELALGQAK